MASGNGPFIPRSTPDDHARAIRRFSVRRCVDGAEFLNIRDRWNLLTSLSPRPSLYLTHDWMAGWWGNERHPGRELYVLLSEEGKTLTGIAPLVRVTRNVAGLRIRRLEFMTMGRYAYTPRSISSSLEMLTDRHNPAPIDGFTSYLSETVGEWDYLRLHPLPEGSETLGRLTRWARAEGYSCHVRPVLANAVIRLPADMDTYLMNLGHGRRKHVRRITNVVHREGGFSVSEVTIPAEIESSLARMTEIERRSWKASGGLSLLRPEIRKSTKWRMEVAAALGGLSVWFLQKDGRDIAFDLSVRFGDSVESLRASFDIAYGRFSPGSYMLLTELGAWMERGATRYNLLWGDFQFKLKWTEATETCWEMYIYNRKPIPRILEPLYMRTNLYRTIRFVRNYLDHRV